MQRAFEFIFNTTLRPLSYNNESKYVATLTVNYFPDYSIKKLADKSRENGFNIDTLSMGMSGDYRAAIFEGSTIVRLGTTIFGERQ